MRRRVTYVLVVLWLAVVGIAAAVDDYGWRTDREQAAFTDGVSAGERVCLIENMDGNSVLLQTDATGRVESLYEASRIWKGSEYRRLVYNGALYAVLSREHKVTNGTEELYRVVAFDKNAKPTAVSPRLRLNRSGELTGLWASEDGFYLTIVMDGRESAGAFYVGKEELQTYTGNEDADEAIRELQVLETEYAEEGRQITEACFENSRMLVYLDNGQGAADFEVSEETRDTFYQRRFPFMRWFELRRGRLGFFGEVLVAGYVILFLLLLVFRDRNYTFYTIAVVEGVLLVVSLGGSVSVIYGHMRTEEAERTQYGYYYMEFLREDIGDPAVIFGGESDIYSLESYDNLRNKLRSFSEVEEIAGQFLDVCLVQASDHQILISARGYNGRSFEEVYAPNAQRTLQALTTGRQKASMRVVVDGKGYDVLGIPIPEKTGAGYLLLGVRAQMQGETLWEHYPYLLIGGLFFLVGSALSILLLLFQDGQIAQLADAMEGVAGGKTRLTKGAVHGRDLNHMWNSLLEISKMIGRINYSRFRTYESCYRFAPKNIETILGKDSITEVKSGDMTVLNGTVAVLSAGMPQGGTQDMAEVMNRFIRLVEKHQEQANGFFMAGQCNLAAMKLLFLESSVDTVAFGSSFMQEYLDDRALEPLHTCIILHYSRFAYGVAGSDTQCFPYLLSADVQEIERYGAWFRHLGMRLVISEPVMRREQPAGESRYIGYIRLGGGENLRFYESLEVCPRQERTLKINTRAKFSRGIELFYQHDFYLARNTFTDVVRENPKDDLARWYVFTCERFLNEKHTGEDVGSLRIEE